MNIFKKKSQEFVLCSLDDIAFNYQGNTEGRCFSLRFSIDICNSNYHRTFDCTFVIRNGVIEQFPWGQGGPIVPLCCGIWIDTSTKNFEKMYNVRQVLSGNKATNIPIFFIPSMSCTMSIQIEFELDDGHIIKVPQLKNIHFYVPYYEKNYYQYLHDGELIDWEALEGNYSILNDFDEFYVGYQEP